MVPSVPNVTAIPAVGSRWLVQEHNLRKTQVFRNMVWYGVWRRSWPEAFHDLRLQYAIGRGISCSGRPDDDFSSCERGFNMPNYIDNDPVRKENTLELKDRSLPKAEEALIRKVLEETDWNLKRSAMLLHIARGTLYSKMGKYNIRRPALPALL